MFSVLSYLAMNASEVGGDLALIQTSLLFLFKCELVSIRTTWFTKQKQWGLYQNKVTSASLPFRGQVTNLVHWSYWKVSQWWGHFITWNGPIMGHLNSFLASGGGNLNKIFQKFKCPGVAQGGGCLSFNLIGTLHVLWLSRRLLLNKQAFT